MPYTWLAQDDGADPGIERRAPALDGGSAASGTPTPAIIETVAYGSPSTDAATIPTAPLHLTEEQLTALWRGRRFPDGALVTRQGVAVRVIFQGRPGRGAGPDFRSAVIAGPSGVPLRGDVELHVRSSSFRTHGHETDQAYANVILHVVFEDDTGADTPLPGGGSAPVVALAPWVARRAEELQRWIERPLLWREPCHDAVMLLGAGGVGAALEAEGDRRFDAHSARIAATVRAVGQEQALYEGLLEAMGYGGNAPQMLSLARLLPWARIAALAPPSDGRQQRFEALLLGSAGLFPSQRAHRGPIDGYVVEMERAFASTVLPSLPAAHWKLWGVRPENAAPRRIAAAAALLLRLGAPSAVLAAVGAGTVNEAIAPLLVSASGYWLHHHDVCANPCRLPPAFIGRSRALEILINVVLPAACASGDAVLAERARGLFARLPRPAAYGVTRFIEEALASERVRVPINARRAQGLLALHRDWCTQNGCGRCPLSS
jgi:stage V sporulation protein SpoVS